MKTLVIVEDDYDIRSILELIFSGQGYDLKLFSSAEEMLQFGTVHADGYLLDINLPGMNGLMLCRRLKDLSTQIPIVIMSADIVSLTKANEYGADHIVQKPFSITELKRKLDVVLDWRGKAD